MRSPKLQREGLENIRLDQIEIGRHNVRMTEQDARLEDLVESIRQHELLQPVVVMRRDGKYDLIIGQRRLRAFRRLKKDTIPAIVVAPMDPAEARLLSLSENIQRVQLNRSDIIDAIDDLYRHFGRSGVKLAKALGVSPATVYGYLKIQKAAPPEVKAMMRQGRIKKADVIRVIEAGGADESKMVELAREMRKLTVPEKERLIPASRQKPKASADELIEMVRSPRVEERIVVDLTPRQYDALGKAARESGQQREEIARVAVLDWLRDRGYYAGE